MPVGRLAPAIAAVAAFPAIVVAAAFGAVVVAATVSAATIATGVAATIAARTAASVATASWGAATVPTTATDGTRLGLEAVAAVDGAIAAGLERYLRILTTGGTGDAEHFAWGPRGEARAAIGGFAGAAAVRTASRFVAEPF
jgi:hypothetical protein